jgi:hypothetical protein
MSLPLVGKVVALAVLAIGLGLTTPPTQFLLLPLMVATNNAIE